MSRVTIRDLHKRFASRDGGGVVPRRGAVDGLDLDIEDGEFFVLLGPSGCGKTTTLRCIAGLERPTSGSISIGDSLVADPAASIFTPANRRAVGMMFQSYALWPHMSVFQNVAYPLRHAGERLSARQIEAQVARVLQIVGLEGYEGRQPTRLSGGQQQRVALARALAARPKVLLFDEPLSNLDTQLRARLRADLRAVHEETGGTSIYVTHDQSEALALADRVAIMRLGRIEQLGTPREIFLTPRTRFIAEFVGYDNILPGQILRIDGGRAVFQADGLAAPVIGQAPREGRAGDRGYVAIRSASLRAGRERSEGAFGAATLVRAAYQGDRFQVVLRIGDIQLNGSASLSTAGADDALERGAVLYPYAEPEDVVVLPEEEQTGADRQDQYAA